MQTVYIEAILMDNDEIISSSKTLGYKKDFDNSDGRMSRSALHMPDELCNYLNANNE